MKQYVHDTMVVFRRAMTIALRNPVWIFVSIFQPILYLTLFGPLLERVAQVPGFPPGDAWMVFVPGLLVQLGIFGASFVGFGIIAEWREGVIERMMVTPARRTALITGRVLRDVVMITMQGLILIGAGFLFGLRVSALEIVATLGIIALLAAAFSYLSYAAGLMLKSEDALAPLINMFALPILLLSGILLPMALAPRWLQIFSDFNPIKHVVDATRAIFRGEIISFEVALGGGLAILIVFLAAFVGNLAIKNQSE